MPTTPVDPRILTFYGETITEDDRLRARVAGRLELLRTQELLRRHLPPAPAELLDIGGGSGVHAEWLVADGYSVRVLDPVPQHVVQAAAIPGVVADVGHAGDLPFADAGADATLLLGPLYHLPVAADRSAALREALRVTRPGGLVAAAGISRYAGLLELAAFGQVDEETEPDLARDIATGVNDPESGFTVAYFHTPDELVGELRAAGLVDVTVYGVEGPSVPALMTMPQDLAAERLDSALRTARLVERDPALIAASPHLLAVGRVTGS